MWQNQAMHTVRFFAAARAAVGASELSLELSTLEDLRQFCRAHSEEFGNLIQSCTFLVDGISESNFNKSLAQGVEIHVLPKFAGG